MIYKSYILEQNPEAFNKNKIFLFYGENEGLKKEFKEKIRIINKEKEILNFFQDEIIKNKNIIFNEISNGSLFEKEKIIFINEVNDKVLDILINAAEIINDEKIYLFSTVLEKKSKLRNYLEKSKVCGVTACYKDNEITIKKIISSKLSSYSGLTPQIINHIIQVTGLDRNKVNNELDKILNYFLDKKINFKDLDSLLNIKSNDDFNELKDEALSGNKLKTNRLLADTVFEAENNVYYLNAINQRINRLKEIEGLKENNSNVEFLISTLKPPVFWKDKPILIQQSKKWNKRKIVFALKKTFDAELQIKSNSSIKQDLIIKHLLIDLCLTASAS